MEVIDAANAFRYIGEKSKGYVLMLFASLDHRIMFTFYESKAAYDKNSVLNMQMGVDLVVVNDVDLLEYPYHITVYDAEAVQRLHRDVICEMFRFWFEDEADKAMAHPTGISGMPSAMIRNIVDEIKYNGRLMFFIKRAVKMDSHFRFTV